LFAGACWELCLPISNPDKLRGPPLFQKKFVDKVAILQSSQDDKEELLT